MFRIKSSTWRFASTSITSIMCGHQIVSSEWKKNSFKTIVCDILGKRGQNLKAVSQNTLPFCFSRNCFLNQNLHRRNQFKNVQFSSKKFSSLSRKATSKTSLVAKHNATNWFKNEVALMQHSTSCPKTYMCKYLLFLKSMK